MKHGKLHELKCGRWAADGCNMENCEDMSHMGCSHCVKNNKCGWCETSKQCMEGDRASPFTPHTCPGRYYTDSCTDEDLEKFVPAK